MQSTHNQSTLTQPVFERHPGVFNQRPDWLEFYGELLPVRWDCGGVFPGEPLKST